MNRRGWLVTMAGVGLNLTLGILYAWSVFGAKFAEAVNKGGFGWSKTQATLPYTIAIACFALMMVPAGRLQDRFGPRVVATVGAVFMGCGLLITSFASADAPIVAMLGFGVVGGTGLGLAYAAATPAALKWFPPEKKGLITGLVVSGFGVAPVYIAPLSKHLLGQYGINTSFRILGVAWLIAAVFFAQLIKNPEKAAPPAPAKAGAKPKAAVVDRTWREMVGTGSFYSLWLQYACAATAGLMIIGHMAKIVSVQSGGSIKIGFAFVALLSIFNASGRIVAGIVSDIIGRPITVALVCAVQAGTMFFFSGISTITGFIVGSALVGFCYGSCLSLFPASAADRWGTKNLGLNYGVLFTAWGVGGMFGPLLAGRIADATGTYGTAYLVSSALLVFAVVLAVLSSRAAKGLAAAESAAPRTARAG